MKLTRLLILPVFAAVATGCTVNHYHYGTQVPAAAAQSPYDMPGNEILEQRLKGIDTAIRVVANNIANVNTNGYKARRANFHEGNAIPAITTDWATGGMVQAPDDLALAIVGRGFFQIEVPEEKGGGIGYTRIGNFFLNRDGEIVLGQLGCPRLANGITVPDDALSISVSADGLVSVVFPDNSMSDIGQIELHSFVSPQGLERGGSGIYFETDRSGPATAGVPGEGVLGTLGQGLLESSNVQYVSEVVELARLTRWSNTIHRQLGLSTTPPPVLHFSPQPVGLEEQLLPWLEHATAAAQATP